MDLNDPDTLLLLILLVLWTLPWKGVALWKAAQRSHKVWFIIILITNSVAVLEIVYIYFVASRYSVSVEEERGGFTKSE